MSYSEVCVIRAIKIGAASEFHAFALLVDIGAFDVLGASVDGLVGRILASAAIVEAYKEVVIVAVLEYERSFNGVFAGLDHVISLSGEIFGIVHLLDSDGTIESSCYCYRLVYRSGKVVF